MRIRPNFRKYRYIALPLALWLAALVLAVLLWNGLLPNQVVSLRVDLGNLLCAMPLLLAAPWIAFTHFSRRRASQSLEKVRSESIAEKRRFIRRLDHELKNPLTAIRAGLANLAETRLDESQVQTLASIETYRHP